MLYDYRCEKCGNETESFNKIDERHTNAPVCCGEPMPIIIKKAPYGYIDRPISYICPVTNEAVTSKAQRREIMAREGLVSAHETMKSKEYRDKQEQGAKDLHKKGFGPKDIQDQVNQWAANA